MAVGTETHKQAGWRRKGRNGCWQKKKICDAVKRDFRPEHPATFPHTPLRASRMPERASTRMTGSQEPVCMQTVEKVLSVSSLLTPSLEHIPHCSHWPVTGMGRESGYWKGQNIYLFLNATNKCPWSLRALVMDFIVEPDQLSGFAVQLSWLPALYSKYSVPPEYLMALCLSFPICKGCVW